MSEILKELSSEIYVQEHRLRYQTEQTKRYNSSVSKFSYKFSNRFYGGSIADFVLDYNKFLWQNINQSHGGYCHKIQANVQGNFHESVSKYDKLVYYLYFQQNSKMSKVKKFLSSVLASAYKDPKKTGKSEENYLI